MSPFVHSPRGFGPPGTGTPGALDDEATGFSPELDLVRQLRLLQEDLRDADTP